MGVSDAVKLLKSATIVNLTGSRIVGAAVEAGYVDKPQVAVVCGVPHAQIVKI